MIWAAEFGALVFNPRRVEAIVDTWIRSGNQTYWRAGPARGGLSEWLFGMSGGKPENHRAVANVRHLPSATPSPDEIRLRRSVGVLRHRLLGAHRGRGAVCVDRTKKPAVAGAGRPQVWLAWKNVGRKCLTRGAYAIHVPTRRRSSIAIASGLPARSPSPSAARRGPSRSRPARQTEGRMPYPQVEPCEHSRVNSQAETRP